MTDSTENIPHPSDEPEASRSDAGDPATDWVSAVRSAYLTILSELELDLDDDYVRRLGEVKRAVAECRGTDDLTDLHPGLESLVRKFGRAMHRERNTHAVLVAEVARRLEELDQDLALWPDSQDASDKAGSGDIEASLARWRDEVRRLNDEVRRAEARSKALAHRLQFDPLTGALTRAAFEARLIQELDRYRRYKRPFVLIFLDVDRFDEINRAVGPTVGDGCLVELVGRLRLQLRRSDVLARYGGEEFVVLLPETDRDRGRMAADKLHQQVRENRFSVQGRLVPITVSVGLTEVTSLDALSEDVVRRADRALSRAQQEGGDRVVAL